MFNIVKFNCHHWALNTYIILGTECHVCWYLYYPVFLFYFLVVFNLTFPPDDFREGSQVPLGQLSLISEQHWVSRDSSPTCTIDVCKEITAGTGSVGKWWVQPAWSAVTATRTIKDHKSIPYDFPFKRRFPLYPLWCSSESQGQTWFFWMVLPMFYFLE